MVRTLLAGSTTQSSLLSRAFSSRANGADTLIRPAGCSSDSSPSGTPSHRAYSTVMAPGNYFHVSELKLASTAPSLTRIEYARGVFAHVPGRAGSLKGRRVRRSPGRRRGRDTFVAGRSEGPYCSRARTRELMTFGKVAPACRGGRLREADGGCRREAYACVSYCLAIPSHSSIPITVGDLEAWSAASSDDA
jgi:hypothetical protein